MIPLYCTLATPNNTTTVIFQKSVDIRRIGLWGGAKVTFYDAASIAAVTGARVVCELRGSVNAPVDEVVCGVGEVLHCANGLAMVGDNIAQSSQCSVRIYTMGNPTGSQGS